MTQPDQRSTVENPAIAKPSRPVHRWFQPAAWVAVAVFLAGRLFVEQTRDLPHFDDEGMETFATVETYQLRKKPVPVKVAIFGSSVSIWGILPGVIAAEIGVPPGHVRKLACQGGTPFDMWNLVRRNPESLDQLRLAVIEVGPRMFDEDTEEGRAELTISQHATLAERFMLFTPSRRLSQTADFALPLWSVRRSLESTLLNIVDPRPGLPIYPAPEARLHPGVGWHRDPDATGEHELYTRVTPESAARRLTGAWRCSKLHDNSMRRFLAWLQERGVGIVLYQMPVHPDVVFHIETNARNAASYSAYSRYVESLGIPAANFHRALDITECNVPLAGMRDHTHLNQTGAAAYSRWLGARLRPHLAAPGGSGTK